MVEGDLMRRNVLMMSRLKMFSRLISLVDFLCFATFAPSTYLTCSQGSWGYLVASLALTLFALRNGEIIWRALCKDARKILTEMEAEQWYR